MAKPVEPTAVGIDVSKDALVIARGDQAALEEIPNQPRAIKVWLSGLPLGSRIALEATGIYHRLVVELAHAMGHRVYLLDGFKLNRYRDSVGSRAKTDAEDAHLILRYLIHEEQDLLGLLNRRAALVQARVALSQSLKGMVELNSLRKRLEAQLKKLEQVIEQRLRQTLKESGWAPEAARCQSMIGVGELTATLLATLYHRGDFASGDAFIAYLGLDVRIRDSGKQTGRRKLTKKGCPEARRLLYTAAMTARRYGTWKTLYEGYLARGLKTTEALVVLARKIARIAFALMKRGTTYQPEILGGGCG
jgi:transposase